MTSKPKIIVFDLDYTLWPFFVDTHVTPPFRKGKHGEILDKNNVKITPYPEVPYVLQKLKDEGYELGIASRTGEIEGANQLLNLFNWKQFFKYKEIYPGCKVTHFNRIESQSKVPFRDMIFFDDEHRNIRDLNEQGVLSVLVKHGVTWNVVEQGLEQFIAKNRNSI